jgi:predicted negative regulator of RcsB-dependent stress response
MAANYSDQEQVDKIKDWLKTNGPGIIAGVVLGLIAIGGWQWWQSRTQAQAEAASGYYNAILETISLGDANQVRQYATELTDEFDNTYYAVLAALLVARLDIEAGEQDAAISQLQWALAQTEDEALQSVIRLRLARVLLAEQQLDQASAELARVTANQFATERAELQGDVYLAREQIDEARRAYETALNIGGSQQLRWKLNSLPDHP